jgi:hypothetical protein
MVPVSKFEQIRASGTFAKLPSETVTTIKRLVLEVCGSSVAFSAAAAASTQQQSVILPPSSTKRYPLKESSGLRRKVQQHSSPSDSSQSADSSSSSIANQDWESLRSFALTKKIEKGEGDKFKDKLRTVINKLTEDTYEEICLELIDFASSSSTNTDVKEILLQTIFDIAISNRFYSQLYARLVAFMDAQFHLKDIILPFTQSFCDKYFNLQKIHENISPTHTTTGNVYDTFCDSVKLSESRKGAAAFVTNLVNQNLVNAIIIKDVTTSMLTYILEIIDMEDKKGVVEEGIECIVFFITIGDVIHQKLSDKSKTVRDILADFSKTSPKKHKSLSAKAIFKCMDIMDSLK